MQKLAGGYGFTKIDLADAYNQIALGPESQKRLARRFAPNTFTFWYYICPEIFPGNYGSAYKRSTRSRSLPG